MLRKLTLIIALIGWGIGTAFAQQATPDCNNIVVKNSIKANEAQGWELVSTDYYAVAYLVAPTPPYLTGSYVLTYTPICEPLEPCPRILKYEWFDVTILNDNGNCVIQPAHP